MTEAKPKPKVIDNPTVHESFSTKLVTTSFDGGAISVTLGALRFVPDRIDGAPKDSDAPSIHVSTRFAMTPSCAVELINALNQTLSVVATQGQQKVAPLQPRTAASH